MSTEVSYPVPKKTLKFEFFVGLFALIGVGCFAYLAINIAGMRLFDTGYYEVTAEFDNVSGLEPGAPVEIAGVAVGSVKRIDLEETSALVTMSIAEGFKLRSDDIASIRTKGIIGDRYVKVVPGAATQVLSGGGKLTDTESVVDLEDIIGKFIHRMDGGEKEEKEEN